MEGKNVTGFTNSEEEAVGLTKVVPFLVEDELKAKGGHFSKTDDWGSPCCHRWPTDYWSEPSLIRACGESASRPSW